MMKNTNRTPYIHLFRTSECCYMYDVNTDKILKLPENVYSDLHVNINSAGNCDETKSYIENLKKKGYMKSDRVEISEHPMTKRLPYMYQNKLSQIIMQVTQSCNLRCEYCIYSGEYKQRTHSQMQMTWETAKKGIDYLIAHSRDSDSIGISFYGGEPFLRFDLLQQCTEYAKLAGEGKEIRFNITTNGTIMNDDIERFLVDNDVRLSFSLDGPEEIHNKHRKFAHTGIGSFQTLMNSIHKIKEDYPEYYKKRVQYHTVMDVENGFSCVNDYASGEEIFSDILFTTSVISNDYSDNSRKASTEFISERNYEFFKILLSRIGKISSDHISKVLFGPYEEICKKRLDYLDNSGTIFTKGHHGGPCIPGAKRLFLNAEGNLYPCERVSEASEITKIGHIDTGINLKKAEDVLNIERHSSDLCRNCWAYRYCSACIKAIDGISDFSVDLLKAHCINMRFSVENTFKDYCVLKETGYDFYGEKCGEIS